MAGIDGIIQIGKRALLANKKALEVTSHNIANANTEGFSRQRVVFTTTTPLDVRPGPIGTGMEIKKIERIYDRFLALQLNNQKQNLGRWEELNKAYGYVESIVTVSSDVSGLSQLMADFWSAWYDLANNPAGQTERVNVQVKGETLANDIRQKTSDFQRIQRNLDSSISMGLNEINLLTQQIASLNEKISQMESGGAQANDYTDQRQNLIEELSYWLNITTFENENGKVTILTSDGRPLVDNITSWNLTAETGASGFYDVKWVDNLGNKTDITSSITGGKLGAWVEMRDTNIPYVLSQMNELASGLIKEVNKTHSQGIGLSTFSTLTTDYAVADPTEELATVDSGLSFYDEITSGSFKVWVYDSSGAVVTSADITVDSTTTLNSLQTALDAVTGITATVNTDNTLTITGDSGNTVAFASDTSNVLMALGLNTFFSGKNALDIGINSVIQGDANKIATGLVTATGGYSAGDNQNALAIASLQDDLKMSSNTATFAEFYANLVGYVGSKAQDATRNLEYQETIFNQLSNYRDSISGVSLDEEMANLVLLQQAYDAAAKLVTMADELFQTLLQMI